MKKKLIIVLFVLLIPLFIPQQTFAIKASGSSATLVLADKPIREDTRAKILKSFLTSYNSPLADHAESFVQTADEHNIDWRLVASISGVESTFGKQIPSNSYNAWGWGIYGDNVIRFSSFDEAIQTITKGLRQRYINEWKAEDVYDIGRYYAASPTWAQRVEFFMNKIEDYSLSNPENTLSISL